MNIVRLIICILYSTINNISFAQTLQLEESWWVPNGVVNSIVKDDSSNVIYVGGSFTSFGPNIPFGSQIDLVSGKPNVNFDTPNGVVYAVVSDENGGWYIGGEFSMVGDSSRKNLAHIDSLGHVSSWVADTDDRVNALTYATTTLFVGGFFSTINGQKRNRLAAFDLISGDLKQWAPDVATNQSGSSYVKAMTLLDSSIYVGGEFSSINGQTRKNIASIHIRTAKLNSWNPSAGWIVEALVSKGNTIYAGGIFTTIGGKYRRGVAGIDIRRGIATSLDLDLDGWVSALAISGDTLYIGGTFRRVNNENRSKLASVNLTTNTVTSWNPRISVDIASLTIHGDNVYAGLKFYGLIENGIVSMDAISGDVNSWNPYANGIINTMSIYDSTMYIGGSFLTVGGERRNGLAALDSETGLLTSWNPNVSGIVSSMLLSDSSLYVGGVIDSVGGQIRNNLASINKATGIVNSWNPNVNGTVGSLGILDSTLYIAGNFDTVGNISRSSLAAIEMDSNSPNHWNPNPNGAINSMIISGNKVYVGGSFSSIGGKNRNNLAAVDAKTGISNSWNPNANWTVVSLVKSGRFIYVGGQFTSIGGFKRDRIAAIDENTGAVKTWNPILDQYVTDMAVSGNNIYVSGYFTTVNGQSRYRFASINTSSGQASSWDPTLNSSIAHINHITIDNDKIYLGGLFYKIDGKPKAHFAAFKPCTIAVTDTITACNSYRWIDGNTYTASNDSATFQILNSSSCDSVISLNLTIIPNDTSVKQLNDSLISNASNANYQWLDCNNNFVKIDGATSQRFIPDEPGSYAVEITQHNCVDTSSCYATSVNIQDVGDVPNIRVFPNPTNEELFIDFGKSIKHIDIVVRNIMSQIVLKKVVNHSDNIQLNLNGKGGIYFLDIKVDNNHFVNYKVLKIE